MKKYDFARAEKKWQKAWDAAGIYAADDKSRKQKWYSLIEFPYPSGQGLHVGHVRSNTAMDIVSRKRRMQGYNVLYPIGWDAFGLPTENYAIKTGIHPAKVTKTNTDTFRRQLKSLGFSFDWSREINTTDPEYYKWTQWIFLQFFKKGLAYKTATTINWCPSCKIGLANEEVVAGNCERCGSVVSQREKEQWMLKITAYADKLLKGLEKVDFLPEIKRQQENWIGRSEGALLPFPVLEDPALSIEVFTTRPDTLYGATYVVLAPEHAIVFALKEKIVNWEEVEEYSAVARVKSEEERLADAKQKTGVCLKGVHAINPATNAPIPVFIADYVLSGYGTGAIMAVPAHDERDMAFADAYDIAVAPVVKPYEASYLVVEKSLSPEAFSHMKKTYRTVVQETHRAWGEIVRVGVPAKEEEEFIEFLKKNLIKETQGGGWYADSTGTTNIAVCGGESFSLWSKEGEEAFRRHGAAIGIPAQQLDIKRKAYAGSGTLIDSGEFSGWENHKAKAAIIKKVKGKKKVNYHLRDWVFSRQRYWGEPIPVVHCAKCGYVAVPERELPVQLPAIKDFKPRDDGESPLASALRWVKTKCPQCSGPAKRETDVMPNWAGSSWYFLRYIDPKNSRMVADPGKLATWMNVDWYNGGMEHVTLHLLYSRFWNQFLYDIGVVGDLEPYQKRTAHGMILGEGGVKMSKSRGNVINPDDVTKIYGADVLRLYEMFMGPFNQSIAWDSKSIEGVNRFLLKVWAMAQNFEFGAKCDPKIAAAVEKTGKKVDDDIEKMAFNTAISAMMIFVNEATEAKEISLQVWERFLKMLAPFAPHMAEELWQSSHPSKKFKSIHCEEWPKWKKIKEKTFMLVVQVNGKVRDTIEVSVAVTQQAAQDIALSSEKVRSFVSGPVKKVIYVPGKIMNLVV